MSNARYNIDGHDYSVRQKQAAKFLKEGRKVSNKSSNFIFVCELLLATTKISIFF
jgi:hypothetical protein